jgi:5-methylcytosine-specific restriction endonuclease McrA
VSQTSGKHSLRGPFVCQNPACRKLYFTRRHCGEGETYCSRACSYIVQGNKRRADAERRKALREHELAPRVGVVQVSAKHWRCGHCAGLHAGTRQFHKGCKADKPDGRRKPLQECRYPLRHTLVKHEYRYCSSLCASKSRGIVPPRKSNRSTASNNRKRARKYGVAYAPLNRRAVMARDGWICQLCGCSTPESLHGTVDPSAPELGHIVPLSRGGSHTYDNVSCECRACNAIKGTQLDEEMANNLLPMHVDCQSTFAI